MKAKREENAIEKLSEITNKIKRRNFKIYSFLQAGLVSRFNDNFQEKKLFLLIIDTQL